MTVRAKEGRNRLLGAAVLLQLLRRRAAVERGGAGTGRAAVPGGDSIVTLYEGVLRDLGVTEVEVEAYLEANAEAVEEAIRGRGRREV